MTVTKKDLEVWIKNAMLKERINNYRLDISGNSEKGDGYLGEITFLTVVAKLEDGKEKNIWLVVKSAKNSVELRKQTPIREAFDREAFMYTEVFPLFKEFQKEHTVESCFDKMAKCYFASNENKKEALILENLKMAGFELHDRTLPQNMNHVLYVFKCYARFHAISLALRNKKPADFKNVTKHMTDVMGNLLKEQLLAPAVRDFDATITILRNYGKIDVADKIEAIKGGLEEYLINYVDPNSPQSVILHGDCWNNNMMFKYESGNTNQPVDMRFIDFQLSRVASPIFDLSYYLYTCADKSVLDHFDFLLQAYHTKLSDSLREFGCHCEDILTYSQLMNHWRKYGKYGLALAPLIIKIEFCNTDEVVDFAESAEKGEKLEAAFDFQLQSQEAYENRLLDVFSHFAENFL